MAEKNNESFKGPDLKKSIDSLLSKTRPNIRPVLKQPYPHSHQIQQPSKKLDVLPKKSSTNSTPVDERSESERIALKISQVVIAPTPAPKLTKLKLQAEAIANIQIPAPLRSETINKVDHILSSSKIRQSAHVKKSPLSLDLTELLNGNSDRKIGKIKFEPLEETTSKYDAVKEKLEIKLNSTDGVLSVIQTQNENYSKKTLIKEQQLKFDLSQHTRTSQKDKFKELHKLRVAILSHTISLSESKFNVDNAGKYIPNTDEGKIKRRFNLINNGKFNAHAQTDEAFFKMNAFTQTEFKKSAGKFTQFPIKFSQFRTFENGKDFNYKLLKYETHGCGGDIEELETYSNSILNSSSDAFSDVDGQGQGESNEISKLVKFFRRASERMLLALAQNSESDFLGNVSSTSKGFILKTGKSVELLRSLPLFSSLKMKILVTEGGHVACANQPKKEYDADGTRLNIKNFITVWFLGSPQRPVYFLRVWTSVTSLKLFLKADLVVAGGSDGGLSFWDLREKETYHSVFQDVIVRTPTIVTACREGPNHLAPIKSLSSALEAIDSTLILSLDETNILIVWRAYHLKKNVKQLKDVTTLQGPVWSTLSLEILRVINLSVLVISDFLFSTTTFKVWENDQKDIFCAAGSENELVGKWTLRVHMTLAEIKDSSKFYFFNETSRDMDDSISAPITKDDKITQNIEMEEDTWSFFRFLGEGQIKNTEIGQGEGISFSSDKSSVLKICRKILNFDLNADKSHFIAACSDNYIRIYDLNSKKASFTFNTGLEHLFKVLWSQQRHSVFYAGDYDNIYIYDMLVNGRRSFSSNQISATSSIGFKKLENFELIGSDFKVENLVVLSDDGTKISVLPPPCDLSSLNDKQKKILWIDCD